MCVLCVFFFQAEDGIRYLVRSRGLGDVYKRQQPAGHAAPGKPAGYGDEGDGDDDRQKNRIKDEGQVLNAGDDDEDAGKSDQQKDEGLRLFGHVPVSYTHLRAHETVLDLVCRLLLEKKKKNT